MTNFLYEILDFFALVTIPVVGDGEMLYSAIIFSMSQVIFNNVYKLSLWLNRAF
jgi:uncharacterized membrane protein (GlpM family)